MAKSYRVCGVRERDSSVSVELATPDCEICRYRLTPKMWARYSLSVGDIIGEDVYKELAALSERCEAMTCAVRILSVSPHSADALCGKLRRRGFSAEAAEAAVAASLRRGLIDEASEAARYAETAARRSRRGPSRIVRDLISRGYPGEVARAAAESVPTEVYETALHELIVRRCRSGVPTDRRERSRLIASVVRAGFSVGEAVQELSRFGSDGEWETFE